MEGYEYINGTKITLQSDFMMIARVHDNFIVGTHHLYLAIQSLIVLIDDKKKTL